MMYSVKSVRPVTGADDRRSPSDGDIFPIGLLGTEKFSAAALVRTRLIWRNRSSQLQPYASVGRFWLWWITDAIWKKKKRKQTRHCKMVLKAQNGRITSHENKNILC